MPIAHSAQNTLMIPRSRSTCLDPPMEALICVKIIHLIVTLYIKVKYEGPEGTPFVVSIVLTIFLNCQNSREDSRSEIMCR